MNTIDSVAALIHKLSNGGRIEYGSGPSHPTKPNTQLRPVLDEMLIKLPFISHDEGYLAFLEVFWEASIWDQVTNTVVNIYPCAYTDGTKMTASSEDDCSFATATRYYRQGKSNPSFVLNMFYISRGVDCPIDIVAVRSAPHELPSSEVTVCHDFLTWLAAAVESNGLLLARVDEISGS